MEFEGKYADMARQLRADGCDERTVERFVREEMEADEWRAGRGVTDLDALRAWNAIPERARRAILANAFCSSCGGVTSFARGYDIRKGKWGIVLEGTCVRCGGPVARMVEAS